MCGFLTEENNETSSIAISAGSVPQIITIDFQLEAAASISLKIYEASGRLIRTLAAEKMEQGSHQVEWNEKDEDGNTVSAGIDILQFDTPNKSETKKLAVIN
jgi:flagellar hook assembly protein FlgD